jgi:hypothetical protein
MKTEARGKAATPRDIVNKLAPISPARHHQRTS